MELSDRLLERCTNILLGRDGVNRRNGRRRRNRRSDLRLNGLLGLRLNGLLGLHGHNGGGHNRLGLNGLGSGRLRLLGAHFEVVGGINRRHGTRMPTLSQF